MTLLAVSYSVCSTLEFHFCRALRLEQFRGPHATASSDLVSCRLRNCHWKLLLWIKPLGNYLTLLYWPLLIFAFSEIFPFQEEDGRILPRYSLEKCRSAGRGNSTLGWGEGEVILTLGRRGKLNPWKESKNKPRSKR